MAVELKWRGGEFRTQFHNATAVGINACSAFYHTECRRAVSRPNSGVRRGGGRGKGGRFKKQTTVYPNPSKPGEPPRLRTGFGQRNIVKEFDASIPAARVGVRRNAMYMFWLEIGTRKVQRRPWMSAMLRRHYTTLGRIAATAGRSEIGN